jgi:hypothetical protein
MLLRLAMPSSPDYHRGEALTLRRQSLVVGSGVLTMVGRKSRPIHCNDGSLDRLRHTGAPIRRDYSLAGPLWLAAGLLRGKPDPPVQRGDASRLLEIQVVETNCDPAEILLSRRCGRERTVLPYRREQQHCSIDQDFRFA